MRSTVRTSVAFAGVGLHSGRPARMFVRPAPAGSGVRFMRLDVGDRDPIVPARWDAVADTRLNTRIENAAGVSVATVEHLMAALGSCGVDDALIDLDGPEVPIMDGSARAFAAGLRRVGLASQPGARLGLRVTRTVEVERDGARATLRPAARFELAFAIDFPDAAIGRQRFAFAPTPISFLTELADCRTFCRLGEVEALRAAGLALGGTLENAVVVDGDRVLSPGGLRRPDEFVRHKALDAIGDLALAGAPILGRYEGERAGHGLNNALLRALFAAPDAWAWDAAPEPAAEPLLAAE
jgi:UDP-3-O-[3-hydroxymyristoyl] N-acetylglucosamine deacetylase